EAAVGLSYQGLRPEEQRLFRLLGRHPGTDFDSYAAAALAGVPREDAEIALEGLLDARLLLQRQGDRYTFHDLLRSYAQSAVKKGREPEPELAEAVHRLLDYYLYTADTAAYLIQPGRLRVELDLAHPPAEVPPLDSRTDAMGWYDAEHRCLLA